MSIDRLLGRLECVRQTQRSRWIARCPAHDDRNPSLSIRELDDGRVLLHDFAGCATVDVLAAVGFALHDLYPTGSAGDLRRERRPFSAVDALRCIASEATLIAVVGSAIGHGSPVSAEDLQRVHTAVARINHALEVAAG